MPTRVSEGCAFQNQSPPFLVTVAGLAVDDDRSIEQTGSLAVSPLADYLKCSPSRDDANPGP